MIAAPAPTVPAVVVDTPAVPPQRVAVRPGDVVRLEMPASEVCLHMGISGQVWFARLSGTGRGVELFRTEAEADDRPFGIPVTPGEAGVFRDGHGGFYAYPANQG